MTRRTRLFVEYDNANYQLPSENSPPSEEQKQQRILQLREQSLWEWQKDQSCEGYGVKICSPLKKRGSSLLWFSHGHHGGALFRPVREFLRAGAYIWMPDDEQLMLYWSLLLKLNER